jgi:hypothetical protein
VGFWFKKRGTDVLALSQPGKMRKIEAIKNRFPVQNSFSISIISHRQRLAHANDSAIIPRDFVFGVDPLEIPQPARARRATATNG